MSLSDERIKGFMQGGLNTVYLHDKDSFIEKIENAFGQIVEDKDVEALLDELIEEGWVEYDEEGNNISQTTPEGVTTGDSE